MWWNFLNQLLSWCVDVATFKTCAHLATVYFWATVNTVNDSSLAVITPLLFSVCKQVSVDSGLICYSDTKLLAMSQAVGLRD